MVAPAPIQLLCGNEELALAATGLLPKRPEDALIGIGSVGKMRALVLGFRREQRALKDACPFL